MPQVSGAPEAANVRTAKPPELPDAVDVRNAGRPHLRECHKYANIGVPDTVNARM